MPAESYPIAQFDHVADDGSLVFSTGHGYFSVELNDALERAMLEAKQIRAEQHEEVPVHQQKTLPISQIQALIRAGADPDQVARKYELNGALVRRFAAPVESEKSYAIEQFLRVPAPKESRVRSLAELIERTLVAARIPRESVQWKATRRGLEPWRITASFQSAGHPIHAEWSWNMHDNTVVCINNAARKLIGEADAAASVMPNEQDDALNEALPNSVNLPGDSARSARIEMAVSAWSEQTGAGATRVRTPLEKQSAAKANAAPQTGDDGATRAQAPSLDTPDVIDVRVETERVEPAGDAAPSHETEAADDAHDAQPAPTKPHAQRGHRSPIPSWDEIMFGKAPND